MEMQHRGNASKIKTLPPTTRRKAPLLEELITSTKGFIGMVRNRHELSLQPEAHNLPYDVLSEIFNYFCSAGEGTLSLDPEPRSNLHRNNPAVVLSHVCQSWREAALQLPAIWRMINVVIPEYHLHISWDGRPHKSRWRHVEEVVRWRDQVVRVVGKLAVWLERSQGCKLTLLFYAKGNFVLSCDERDKKVEPVIIEIEKAIESMIRLLVDPNLVWASISVSLDLSPGKTPFLPLLHLPHPSTGTLHSFNLDVFTGPRYIHEYDQETARELENIGPAINSLSSPTLRFLSLHSIWFPISKLPIAWSTLTSLTFSGYCSIKYPNRLRFNAEDALSLLKWCPRLEEARLAIGDGEPGNYTPDSIQPPGVSPSNLPVCLPFLHTLWLAGDAIPQSFALSLDLPSLTTLISTAFHWRYQSQQPSGIAILLERFGAQLRTAVFPHAPLGSSELLRCFELIPNVEELGLGENVEDRFPRHDVFSREVLMRLAGRPSPSDPRSLIVDLCPRLVKFSCVPRSREFGPEDLLQFITARRKWSGLADALEGEGRKTRPLLTAVKVCYEDQAGNTWGKAELRNELEMRRVDVQGFVLDTVPDFEGVNPYTFSGKRIVGSRVFRKDRLWYRI